MPDIPDKAVQAAAEAMREIGRKDPWLGSPVEDVARAALEAAAPILADYVARKITAHKDAHDPKDVLGRAWRRHFGIAVQIASLAFSTEEDIKRAAAGALNRGDYIRCPALETGEGDGDA